MRVKVTTSPRDEGGEHFEELAPVPTYLRLRAVKFFLP
jgi:hypothetical protein